MTDRELLELAAKAAGIPISFSPEGLVFTPSYHDPRGYQWNPLENDGDALRLAVELRLSLTPLCAGQWEIMAGAIGGTARESLEVDNPCAATRRAIVRAAAEMGRAIK